jgi:hypothetical protein
MLPDPANVGAERFRKLISTLLELRLVIEEDKIELRQRFGNELVVDPTPHHRGDRLLSDAASATSFSAISDATASGLMTKTTVSARLMSASMRSHHCSKA